MPQIPVLLGSGPVHTIFAKLPIGAIFGRGFVIATLAILLLLFLPFLDRRGRSPVRKRPVALTVSSLSVLLIVLLNPWRAFSETQRCF